MRNYIIFIGLLLIIPACSTLKTADSSASSERAARLDAMRASVESSIQSGTYLVKMERLDGSRGFNALLAPEFNYIIINKGTIRMKLGYAGRQYDFRGIAAINMAGKTQSYEVVRDTNRKRYEVSIKASQGGELFKVFLKIDDRGNCTASIYNNRIETVRYSGRLFTENTPGT